MSKLVIVVGITGNQGGSVADAFVCDNGWRIRAVTREPSKPSAQEWASKGVELVQGDMDDVASLVKAFTGATTILYVTSMYELYVRHIITSYSNVKCNDRLLVPSFRPLGPRGSRAKGHDTQPAMRRTRNTACEEPRSRRSSAGSTEDPTTLRLQQPASCLQALEREVRQDVAL